MHLPTSERVSYHYATEPVMMEKNLDLNLDLARANLDFSTKNIPTHEDPRRSYRWRGRRPEEVTTPVCGHLACYVLATCHICNQVQPPVNQCYESSPQFGQSEMIKLYHGASML
ncbi:hypothetical protein ElyMa_005493900 [Elysia marginata]|uniref:Uncharacterized protein n=1 Tax=Elysia marginata TaxID=1093978 RepID=A0AAV4ESV5_9GAST|nr:hypothetical protein ElyMa_005493900 [Elysia marginata]